MENQLQKSPPLAERRTYWREQLLQWSQSGLTQKQFCQKHGLSRHAFVWWKARYRDELNLPYRAIKTGSAKRNKHRFVEVKVSSRMPEPAYEVVLANSRCIRLSEKFDADVLTKLIAVVESVC